MTNVIQTKVDSIQEICAIGAGAMGAGTALAFAMSGRNVHLWARREGGPHDPRKEGSLYGGMESIHHALESYRQHGMVQEDNIPAILNRIHPIHMEVDLEKAARKADLVIESIAEDLAIKQEYFGRLDKICKPEAIFATNTSSLGPTDIADAVTRKDKFVVTHFWNPPHLIPLVEVVPGKYTSKETTDIAYGLIEAIGKEPVLVTREVPGFIGNRLQIALLREALHLHETGVASAADIDRVVRLTMGRRLAETGPLESLDLGGHDVFAGIFKRTGGDLCNHPGVPAAIQRAVESGNLGAKTGQGIYEWPSNRKTETVGRRVAALFHHLSNDLMHRIRSASHTSTAESQPTLPNASRTGALPSDEPPLA